MESDPEQLAYFATFAIVCWVLLVAPFEPAWREWRYPSDSDALPLSQDESEETADGRAVACELHLARRSVAAVRLASHERVVMEPGCCFRHVHAPTVCFGTCNAGAAARATGSACAEVGELPAAVRRAPGLWRIQGDCSVPPGRTYAGSLVVTGRLWMGEASHIEGSVKAHESMVLCAGATISGAAICAGPMHLEAGAAVGGPLVSEGDVLLCAGARIGSPTSATTLSAARLVAEDGACAHGTVHAREAGVVMELAG